MRFQLVLKPEGNQPIMPINYQYPFSAWVYKTIANADSEYAEWLHDKGYTNGLKTFKLLTFSRLMVQQPKPKPSNRLAFASKPFRVELGFYLDEVFRPFITGLFTNTKGQIADSRSRFNFEVLEVQRLTQPELQPKMEFDTISPVHINQRDSIGRILHLSPYDQEYENNLFTNLMSKYRAGNPNSSLQVNRSDFRFELAGPIKERLITIKEFSNEETKLKAFDYKCRLTAPPELMEVAMNTGLGKSNTMGFGMIRNI